MASRKKTPHILSDLLGGSPGRAKQASDREVKASDQAEIVRPEGNVSKSIEDPVAVQSEKGNATHFITFTLENRKYALPLDHVERALRAVALIPIPEAEPWVAGMLNLHGRAIPVMDLRKRFGYPSREVLPDDRLLVTRAHGRAMAIMVDQVDEVLGVQEHQMEAPDESISRTRPVTAIIRKDDHLIMVLNAVRLIPAEQRKEAIGKETSI